MAQTTLPVSSVVNVQVQLSPIAAALRNFGAMCILGSSDVIPTTERIRLYSSISDVADDFGTTAPEYLASLAFFSQSPRPSIVYIARIDLDSSEPETYADVVAELLTYTTWYGLFIASSYSTAEALAVSALIEAASPSRICAWTSQDANELVADSTTLGSQLHDLAYKRSIVMYSSQTAYAAMSLLGRMATVNFEGSNTTITLKFKQCPGVVAENLTSNQYAVLKSNCVNVFAAFQNDTSILQEGVCSSGWFIDEIHGLDWLQNRVETDLWNVLYTTNTKVGQDEAGMNLLVATVTKSLEQAVRNRLLAPGVWNGDSFGALETGDTLSTGFYVYITPLSEQSQSDREARKAPPIQVAAKLSGAVHFVDVTITVNR